MILKDYLIAKAFCKGCEKGDYERDKTLVEPDDVVKYKDLSYGKYGISNLLDIYRPEGVSGKLPLIINVHGGGFVYGDKELYRFYSQSLSQLGFAVCCLNYRLAPKYRFPTPIIDVNEAVKWLTEHADKYDIDMNNVIMVGDSAGAQIVSQYATCYSNKTYADIMEIKIPQFKLKGVGLNCGLYNISPDLGVKLSELERVYLTKNPQKYGEKINVINYIDENYPPTYLISAPGDFLIGCIGPMEELLKSKNVPVKAKIYGDEHTYHVFHCDIKTELAKCANKEELEYLKGFLD
jgi:hypothetical protein